MFNVGRFDPRQQQKDPNSNNSGNKKQRTRKRNKKRRKDDNASSQEDSSPQKESAYVIAPEAKPTTNAKRKHDNLIAEEAFDDMEIDMEAAASATAANGEDGRDLKLHATGFRTSDPTPQEIQRALHMSSLTIEEAASKWQLAPFLVKNLQKDGITNFFPIQSLVIPDIMRSERHSYVQAQDICVAAPTGSGKTLAFVLPILQALSKTKIRRLRALVVLPSRDLATQVHKVFKSYSKGSNLEIGLAIGQSDFRKEQFALTVDQSSKHHPMFGGASFEAAQQKCLLEPGNPEFLIDTFSGFNDAPAVMPKAGRSAVDVLVCTPGRLVDHLDNTPGFTLQHLRFLVVDEADRLLSQTYHNWIQRVVQASHMASASAWNDLQSNSKNDDNQSHSSKVPQLRESPDGCSFQIDMITWRRCAPSMENTSVVASVCQPKQLRKMLYSATLTRDPQKLASLHLVNPKHFDAHKLQSLSNNDGNKDSRKYTMPKKLKEYAVECTAEQKPIVLLALLLERLQIGKTDSSTTTKKKKTVVAVFTSNVESTHRLARLLQLLWRETGYGTAQAVAEFSSSLSQQQRSQLVKRCNDLADPIAVVICSDGMARGLDLRQIATVINYDIPLLAKTYVHRCGRTARAGMEGSAISLLKGGQVRQFNKMRSTLIDDPDRVQPMGIDKTLVMGMGCVYKSCLRQLAEVVAAEDAGELATTEPIPDRVSDHKVEEGDDDDGASDKASSSDDERSSDDGDENSEDQ